MSCRNPLLIVTTLMLLAPGNLVAVAQDQKDPPLSFRFNRPIPVSIRKSTNTLVEGMLLGIDEEGITIMTSAKKTFHFPNDTVRTVASPNSSFFYAPGKMDPAEMIQRLNKMNLGKLTSGQGMPAQCQCGEGGRASGSSYSDTDDACFNATVKFRFRSPARCSRDRVDDGTLANPGSHGIPLTDTIRITINTRDSAQSASFHSPDCHDGRLAGPAAPERRHRLNFEHVVDKQKCHTGRGRHWVYHRRNPQITIELISRYEAQSKM